MATSMAAGYLTPLDPPIPYDDDLLNLLQPILVGIGGYPDSTLVRPGWQFPDTPNQPDYAENWLAFRAPRIRSDEHVYEVHVDDSEGGYNSVESTEEIDLLLSCYGPKAQTYAKVLRDGFRIGQNRWPLQQLKIDVLSVGEPATLPSLLHGTWLRRVDLTIVLRRYTSQRYGVRTVVGLPQTGIDVNISMLDNGQYITPLT